MRAFQEGRIRILPQRLNTVSLNHFGVGIHQTVADFLLHVPAVNLNRTEIDLFSVAGPKL